jgi:hypothetical protein
MALFFGIARHETTFQEFKSAHIKHILKQLVVQTHFNVSFVDERQNRDNLVPFDSGPTKSFSDSTPAWRDSEERSIMKRLWSRRFTSIHLASLSLTAAAAVISFIPILKHFQDKTAPWAFSTAGNIDEKNPFFQSWHKWPCCVLQADQGLQHQREGVRET